VSVNAVNSRNRNLFTFEPMIVPRESATLLDRLANAVRIRDLMRVGRMGSRQCSASVPQE
jgi:hypothetical protein